jgi:hypothetical protein
VGGEIILKFIIRNKFKKPRNNFTSAFQNSTCKYPSPCRKRLCKFPFSERSDVTYYPKIAQEKMIL